jgi:hypothetical protein
MVRAVVQRRSEAADWLTDRHIAFALRRVAAELGALTVTPQDYETVTPRLIQADRAAMGDDAVLARVLPTTDQLRTYCRGDWDHGLRLAGLAVRTRGPAQSRRTNHSVRVPRVQENAGLAGPRALRGRERRVGLVPDAAALRTQGACRHG